MPIEIPAFAGMTESEEGERQQTWCQGNDTPSATHYLRGRQRLCRKRPGIAPIVS